MSLLTSLMGAVRGGRNTSSDVRGFFLGSLVAAGVVEVVVAIRLKDADLANRFLLLNLILGGAAGFAGGLLGFVFGVPRALTQEGASATESSGRQSRPNTNLEQISDWLTKILVGASLTSLTALPAFAVKVVRFLDNGAYHGLPGGGTFAVFLAVYFATAGFFWSYIETRTSLTELFDDTFRSVSAQSLQIIRAAPSAPDSQPIPPDAQILKLKLDDLKTVELLDARGSAEMRAKNWASAIDAFQRALTLSPSNLQIQNKLSFALSSAGQTGPADALIAKAEVLAATADNPSLANQVQLAKLYNALYKPQGFEAAIHIGEKLTGTDQGANGNLYFYLACAYGQRAADLKKKEQPIQEARDLALIALKKVKELRPDLLDAARAHWNPEKYGGTKDQNDLEVFLDDPEFNALLTS